MVVLSIYKHVFYKMVDGMFVVHNMGVGIYIVDGKLSRVYLKSSYSITL